MARQPVWNFHNARLSLAQSCVSELIGRSTVPNGRPSNWLTRAGSGFRGMIGEMAQPAQPPGLAPGHPVMQTLGKVLDQINRGELTDARKARAVFRVEQPACHVPRRARAGSRQTA